MEKLKITKEKLIKIKDIIIFVLLFFWMIMPILQTFHRTYIPIMEKNLYMTLMKIIGGFGIGTAIFTIYDKFQKAENKKDVIKQFIPIFLFVLYMIWTLISANQADRKLQAFKGNSYRKEGYYMYINYAGFFLCAMLLENKKLRKMLLNSLLITAIFLTSVSRICLDGARFDHIFGRNKILITVFYQYNHYGYFLMMSLICSLGLFINEKNKYLKAVYLVIYTWIGYTLIFNDTFGCYLATVAILTLYGIYSIIKKIDRKTIFIAIAIFAILSGVTFNNGKNLAYENIKQLAIDLRIIKAKAEHKEKEVIDGEEVDVDEKFEKTGTNRMELWTNGIKFALDRPILGHGPDNLKDKYLRSGIDQDRPHNLIIYLACVSGFPGMIIYVTAVSIIIIRGIKKLFKGDQNVKIYLMIVITYLISSMFGNSMFYTSPFYFIFLGSLMHYNLKEKEE